MRRGCGRPFRRAFAADIPPLLQRANQMMANGNYLDAASAFEQLARAADARGGPRAPLFYVQADRARILAGQTAGGVEYLERGLGLFAARGQQGRASNVGVRVIGELNERGLAKEAGQVTDYLKLLVGKSGRGYFQTGKSHRLHRLNVSLVNAKSNDDENRDSNQNFYQAKALLKEFSIRGNKHIGEL